MVHVHVTSVSYCVMCYINKLYIQYAYNLPIVKPMCQILTTVITETTCCVMFNENRHSQVSHSDRVVGLGAVSFRHRVT